MNLSNFILHHMKTLLQEWEKSFDDASEPISRISDRPPQRDYAEAILRFIAKDMTKARNSRISKANNSAAHPLVSFATMVGTNYGNARRNVGQTLVHMVSEQLALRAIVTRLWKKEKSLTTKFHEDELILFNERMDRLLSDSISGYSSNKEKQTRLFETMLQWSPDQCVIFDTEARFFYLNNATVELIGKPREEIIGKTPFEANVPFAADLEEYVRRVIKTGEVLRGEISHHPQSGGPVFFDCFFVPIYNDQGEIEAVSKTSRDISDSKNREYQTWKNANFDLLTGLPNRRLFFDRLDQSIQQAMRTKSSFELLFIDLDRFKQMNDRLGHSYGDLLLKQVAERIGANVRKVDTVARLSGDEFTVILKNVEKEELMEAMAKNMLKDLADTFQLGEHMVNISGSIGIARCPRDGYSLENLLSKADKAMYAAKKAGGDRVVFYDPSIHDMDSEHAKIGKELEKAFKNNELTIHYQPIIDLQNNKICGAEALLRWSHPVRGMLSPVTFLYIAEDTGFLNEIDRWVFREAAAFSRRLKGSNSDAFAVFVNTSITSLHSADNEVKWNLLFNEVEKEGGRLTMEVTETSLSNASSGSRRLIKSLNDHHIKLAVKNFGLGHFSMTTLTASGVTLLKIDQTFVQGLERSESDRMITNSTIAMAHSLGLKVIAEGVETAQQRDYLTCAGCDYAQGFWFSRPLPEEAFQDLLRT